MSVFWRWWAAGTTSDLGSAVGGVALPLTALTVLDATPFQMGMIAASGYVAWIVIGLPAGVIVQRLPLRGTQLGADLIRAVAVASIPVAWWFGLLTIAQLVLVALVLSFAHVVFFVANTTFLPEIVSRDQLQSRNSLTSGTTRPPSSRGPRSAASRSSCSARCRPCSSTPPATSSPPPCCGPCRPGTAAGPTSRRRWAR